MGFEQEGKLIFLKTQTQTDFQPRTIYVLPNGMLESEPIFIVSSFSEFIDGLSDEEY